METCLSEQCSELKTFNFSDVSITNNQMHTANITKLVTKKKKNDFQENILKQILQSYVQFHVDSRLKNPPFLGQG